MRALTLSLTLALLAACSGGVPDETLMADLEAGDLETLCAELAAPEREVVCQEGDTDITYTIGGTEAECIVQNEASGYEGCDVTVGDVRACTDAYDDMTDEQVCEVGFPAECLPILECAFGD